MKLSRRLAAFFVTTFAALSVQAQFSFTPTPVSNTTSPIVLNVGQNYPSAAAFTIVFNQAGGTIQRIELGGTMPPGLTLAGSSLEGGRLVLLNRPNGVIQGTPTAAGDYVVTVVGVSQIVRSDSQGAPWEIYFRVVAAGIAPTISAQPQAQTVTAGANVTFTAAADGTPAPSYQWRKDGVALPGATSATLTLTAVTAASAGAYSVVATNSGGTATSAAATLTVNPLIVTTAPTIKAQPISVTASAGGTVAFVAAIDANPAPAYQWRKGTTPITGATSATLMLRNVAADDAASYTLVATNSVGTTTTAAAVLTLSPSADFGRIVNLSILTDITATDRGFTLGVVIGGPGTSGTKPLLIRAAGPALTQLGVGGVLSDPRLEVFSGQTSIAVNDDWGGGATLSNAFAAVGAFAYAAGNSKDAATFNPTTAAGAYTIQVNGVGSATGAVIAELYDSTPPASFTATTPRLSNVSVLKQIPASTLLTAGFVIGGSTAKTVLVRAIGPALGATPFNLGGVMADPKLDLYGGQTVVASNDNWGGDLQITAAGNSVAAFAVANAASRDAILLVTLPPGAYTAQVSGVGTSGGLAIVEVYEVP